MRIFFQLTSAFFAMCLGTVAWAAPHLDWSRVKDESLFSTRGLVVLGMMVWVFLTLVLSSLAVEPNRRKP